MDPITMAAILAPTVGGIAGNLLGASDRSAASDAERRALQAIQGVALPDIEKMKLALEEYQRTGEYTPELEQFLKLSDTELKNITENPELKTVSMDALRTLSGLSKSGMDDIERARLSDLLNQTAAQEQSRQKSILENRQMRGMGGSGDELAAQLQSSQSATNRASNEALQIAAQAMQNRMNATGQAADLSRSLSNEEYRRASELASAKDIINRFNTSNQQDVLNRNVALKNEALKANLAERQRIADANVGLRNTQQTSNKSLEQQQFENAMRRATGVASGESSYAASKRADAAATGNMFSGIGSGLGQAGMAYNLMNKPSDKTEKKDVISSVVGTPKNIFNIA